MNFSGTEFYRLMVYYNRISYEMGTILLLKLLRKDELYLKSLVVY